MLGVFFIQIVFVIILLVSDTYFLNFPKQFEEYVEKNNAYFKKVDEFDLEIEYSDELEVESSDELDHPTYLKRVKVESSDELDHLAYFKKVGKVQLKVESSDELHHNECL